MQRVDKAFETVHLKGEIDRLLEKQGNALKVATHIGLTPAEASQCNARHVEMIRLVRQLASAESASTLLANAPRESTREADRSTQQGGTWWGLLSAVLKA